jgi:hypothetical protein
MRKIVVSILCTCMKILFFVGAHVTQMQPVVFVYVCT